MTRPKISRYPVSSFGPELMAILLRGSRERVELPCPDQRTMKHLQMRIQMLRGAMAREKHPNYDLVTRARTSRTWDTTVGKDHKCVLVIAPNDSQFASILKDANIDVTVHDRELLTGIEETPLEAPLDPSNVEVFDPYAKFKGG